MTISIRKATVADSQPLTGLSNQLGYKSENEIIRNRLIDILDQDENCIFVAVADQKIVGWIHAFYCRRLESDPFIEIGGLVVDENYRKNGIGKMLVEKVQKWPLASRCASLRVRCNSIRESHLFYEKIGFRLSKQQKVYDKKLL